MKRLIDSLRTPDQTLVAVIVGAGLAASLLGLVFTEAGGKFSKTISVHGGSYPFVHADLIALLPTGECTPGSSYNKAAIANFSAQGGLIPPGVVDYDVRSGLSLSSDYYTANCPVSLP